MVYTDIQTLRGLDNPVDYGSGIEYADGVLDLFPPEDVGLQIGMWLNGTDGCKDILSGALDENIDLLMKYLKDSKATKVFLRVGYEFDNPSFGYSDDPDSYVQAYQKIFKTCKNADWSCRDKVKFVWHSWAAPRAESVGLVDFYPGDDFVDWIGISIFQQFFPWAPWAGQLHDLEEVLEFAMANDKPTMIAESTPFGGIDLDAKLVEEFDLDDAWDRWFQPTLDLIDKYDIGMWSYINCDWESQPMWHNIGFGETRLSTNKLVMKKWRSLILRGGSGRTFLMAGSLNNYCESPDAENPSTTQEESFKYPMDKHLLGGRQKGGAVFLISISVFIFVLVRKRYNMQRAVIYQRENANPNYASIVSQSF